MKRHIFLKTVGICSIAAVLSASLTACGNSTDESDESTGTSSMTETSAESSVSSVPAAETTAPVEESKAEISRTSSFNIGDIVTFGHYDQDNNEDNGAEPIQWEVIDIQDGKALLLSRYVIDNASYNEPEGVEGSGVTEERSWESSDVYNWLTADFANAVFTNTEAADIAQDGISADEQGVFLLSFDEAIRYFDMQEGTQTKAGGDEDEPNEARIVYSQKALCKASPKADKRKKAETFEQDDYDYLAEHCSVTYDESVIGNSYSSYWLRTSHGDGSENDPCAYRIDETGLIKPENTIKTVKTREDGIRPAVWVNASSSAVTITDGSETPWDNGSADVAVSASDDWSITGNKLTITHEGELPEEWKDNAPWKEQAANIEEIEFIGVTELKGHYFDDFVSLKKVTFDSSLTKLSTKAFAVEIDGETIIRTDVVVMYNGSEYDIDSLHDLLRGND